jgi:hypothetical protein
VGEFEAQRAGDRVGFGEAQIEAHAGLSAGAVPLSRLRERRETREARPG